MIGALLVAIGICGAAMSAGLAAGGYYGFGLFCVAPFAGGFGSVWWYLRGAPRTNSQCMGVAAMSVLSMGAALLLVRIEGLICLLMASPLALLLALSGGQLAYVLRRSLHSPATLGLCVLLSPGVTTTESAIRPQAPLIEVRSAVEIDNSPATVWKNVVEFSDLPTDREWLFHIGIAYPLRATIHGTGPGAIRECVFTTGPFIEPIEVWDAPRLLRFTVVKNPAPMSELSPWPGLKPPHLDGYLASERGQFQLTALPGGRTRLEGTTWYRHHLWPAAYWTLWSDYIIHRIHMRVLHHVKRLSETALR